jgi:hypothetical protein
MTATTVGCKSQRREGGKEGGERCG